MKTTVTTEEFWKWGQPKQYQIDKWLTSRFGSGWTANQIESITWEGSKITIVGQCYAPGWDESATPNSDPSFWCHIFDDPTAPNPWGR